MRVGGGAMHRFERLISDLDDVHPPSIEVYRFRGALDVVALAQVDRCIGWKTWPEVWHLDEDGAFACYYKGSTLDSIQRWAEDPSPLRRSRIEGLASGGCADRWVIVDSRPTWLHEGPTTDESDVEAFLHLRPAVEAFGVSLLDVVIFDDDQHWWSLHELTAGTTAWPPPDAGGCDLPADNVIVI
jgi:hypothetical protein